MNLPDGSGIDVVESMDEQHDRITTVVLTATGDEAIRQRCQDLNVNDYITKPVHEDKFMRVVRDHKKLMIHSTPLLSETSD